MDGRTVSPARWNKPLLLPKLNTASDTDFTPAGATATAWSRAPDWIVMARDGTNPVAWNTGLLGSGVNPAVGRFAYNIYDEGGLLDANVAGCPTDPTVASPQGYYPAYKKALAFADLKQLSGISDLPAARQEQVIRTLAGWRNYASSGIDPTAVTESDGSTATAGGTYSNDNNVNQSASPGFSSKDAFSFRPGLRSLMSGDAGNTTMTFNVSAGQTGASLFREPTLLFRPGKPTNSNLAAPGLASIMFPEHLTQFAGSGGGVTSAVSDNALNNAAGQGYIGFYLGAFPLNWVVTVNDSKGRSVDIKLGASGPRYADEAAPKVTFDLQYQDPLTGNWITYDEKYATPPGLNDDVLVTSSGGFFNSRWKNMAWAGTVDPRTSRFAIMDAETFNGSSREQISPIHQRQRLDRRDRQRRGRGVRPTHGHRGRGHPVEQRGQPERLVFSEQHRLVQHGQQRIQQP